MISGCNNCDRPQEALQLFNQMHKFVFSSVLSSCARSRDLNLGQQIHALVLKRSYCSVTFIVSSLILVYMKCGMCASALSVFYDNNFVTPNLHCFNIAITGLVDNNLQEKGMELFVILLRRGLLPDQFTFAGLLGASGETMYGLSRVLQLHCQMVKLGLDLMSLTGNVLMTLYSKFSLFEDSDKAFRSVREKDIISWNTAITNCRRCEDYTKALDVYREMMEDHNVTPDDYTYAGVLSAAASTASVRTGKEIHGHLIRKRPYWEVSIGTALVNMYAKCGYITSGYSVFSLFEESEKEFRLIEEKDVISWNTVITNCCQCKDYTKAVSIFREMVGDHNVNPDDYTYSSVLSAAASMASLRIGKEIHGRLIRTRPYWEVSIGTSLVNMYAKCGYITSGYTVFEQMEIRNFVSWNTIIAAFANHGHAEKAMALFEEMKETGLESNAITFLHLLTACNNCGLADAGQMLFESMSKVHGITPKVEHLRCLADLLGRAGSLSKAEEYTHQDFGDNAVVLGSLLSACQQRLGDVSVGERIAKRLVKTSSSSYI